MKDFIKIAAGLGVVGFTMGALYSIGANVGWKLGEKLIEKYGEKQKCKEKQIEELDE